MNLSKLLGYLRKDPKVKPDELKDVVETVTGKKNPEELVQKMHKAQSKEDKGEIITQFLAIFFERDLKLISELDVNSEFKNKAIEIVSNTLNQLMKLTSSTDLYFKGEKQSSSDKKPIVKTEKDLKNLKIKLLREELSAYEPDTNLISNLKHVLNCTITLGDLAKDEYLIK